MDNCSCGTRRDELEDLALEWGKKDTDKILELAATIDKSNAEWAARVWGLNDDLDKANEEIARLRNLICDQHYYETDCSACADNFKAAKNVEDKR